MSILDLLQIAPIIYLSLVVLFITAMISIIIISKSVKDIKKELYELNKNIRRYIK